MNKIDKLNQAVIFAGGRGERLKPITDNIPKPMVSVNGYPFLDYLINSIFQVGIRRIIILVGYKAEIIMNRYGDSLRDGTKIEYSIGTVEHQTGRRLLDAYKLLDEHFLLLYGDNYWPIEIDNMLDLYNKKNARALTTIFSNKNGTGEYGNENNTEIGDDNFIKQYDKQRKSSGLQGVDIGYFIIKKDALNPDLTGNISFEQDMLPGLISERQLVAYITDSQYYYITNMDSLKNFESIVIEKKFKPIPAGLFYKVIV